MYIPAAIRRAFYLEEKRYKLLSERHPVHKEARRVKYVDGSLGGFIESESNLPHYHNAKVLHDSVVLGTSKILHNSVICYDSVVIDSRISGNSTIKNSRVEGDAFIFNSEIEDSRLNGDSASHFSIKNSKVTKNSRVYGGDIEGSTISSGVINDGSLQNCKVINGASIINGNYINFTFEGNVLAKLPNSAVTLDNGILSNGITNGNITFPQYTSKNLFGFVIYKHKDGSDWVYLGHKRKAVEITNIYDTYDLEDIDLNVLQMLIQQVVEAETA